MRYSIFHTSQCGSTLLATLLKDKKRTYAEPPWACRVDMLNIFSAEDETIVKYPSFASLACRVLPGKKIFIFRELNDHLEKITSKPNAMKQHLSLHYQFNKSVRNLFPKVDADNDLKKLAFVWAHMYLDAFYSQDVLFIDANEFFLEPIITLKKITTFFNFDPVEDLEPLEFYVKTDFLASENNLSEIKPTEKIPFNIKDGYIKSTNYSEVVNWVEENIFSQIISNEIFPLFRNNDGIPIYSFIPGKTFSFQ
tara:strand:+ start:356 stop:1111 length:756 start_codon:yes stop_codon:yes gene_type:complete